MPHSPAIILVPVRPAMESFTLTSMLLPVTVYPAAVATVMMVSPLTNPPADNMIPVIPYGTAWAITTSDAYSIIQKAAPAIAPSAELVIHYQHIGSKAAHFLPAVIIEHSVFSGSSL